jgi:hypothetical protein
MGYGYPDAFPYALIVLGCHNKESFPCSSEREGLLPALLICRYRKEIIEDIGSIKADFEAQVTAALMIQPNALNQIVTCKFVKDIPSLEALRESVGQSGLL